MQKHLVVGMVALSAVACQSTILNKAKLQAIQGIAVASLYAVERIPEVRGQGVLRKLDREARLQIAGDALVSYQDAFETLGWEVVPTEEVIAAQAYKGFQRPKNAPLVQGAAASAFQQRFFLPNDMVPLWLGDVEKRSGRRLARSDKDSLIDLLKELHTHAAALVQIKYCFRTFERERIERTVVTATSALQLVDSKGEVLYMTAELEGCGGATRSESRASMEIVGQDWTFDPLKRDAFRQLFQEASEAEAERLISSLPVTPKPKRRG